MRRGDEIGGHAGLGRRDHGGRRDVVWGTATAIEDELEPRVLLSISVSGTVWQDADRDGERDAGEPAAAAQEVFLDQNRNRVRDAGEQATTTDALGRYAFTGLPAGRFYVSTTSPIGSEQSFPGPSGAHIGGLGLSPTPVQSSLNLSAPTVAPESTRSRVAAFPATDAPSLFTDNSALPTAPVPSLNQSGPLIGLDKVDVDPRFAAYDGRGMAVAVLDTGIDLDHPFFGPDADGNGVADRIVYQWDFAHGDADAGDRNGHGSNVSSIVGSQDAVYRGVAPGVGIAALKVFEDGGGGQFAYIEQALQWVVANAAPYNIAAVNMSLGDQQNFNAPLGAYGIDDELAALSSMGVIVVSAAGNSYAAFQAQGVSYPAADPSSLAVSAVYDANVGGMSYFGGAVDYLTAPDRVASFSQRSTTMTDVFAPGAIVTGAWRDGETLNATGTSQAAPHVAGMAAVAQQMALHQLGRRLSASEFRSMLRGTGVTIYDGDDENDNVVNTNANYPRLDAFGFADTIYAGGTALPFGYRVDLADGQSTSVADFGLHPLPIVPGAPSLAPTCDTGFSNSDRITSWDNSTAGRRLQFVVPGTYAGSTVTLYADGQAIGVATGAKRQTTVLTSGTTDLLDGTHVITARQTVPGRPQSADSPGTAVVVDTVAPAAPTFFDLVPSSDSGISDRDRLTNDPTPTFAIGGVPAGTYFRMTLDGVEIGGPFRVGSSYTAPLTTDGTHAFQVQARDVAGNSSGGVVADVTIDTLAWNPDPVFDNTFGSGGSLQVSATGFAFNDMIAQPDGKLLVASYDTYNSAGDTKAVISRLNANGTPDTSFGTGGRIDVSTGDRTEYLCLEVLPGGKILAGGTTSDFADGWYVDRFLLTRFNPNGTVDTSFGSNGFVFSQGSLTGGQIRDLDVRPDGKIVVAGWGAGTDGDAPDGLTLNFFLARYTAGGQLDQTFGTGGTTSVDFMGWREEANAMAVAPDGKIVVTGLALPEGEKPYALTARYDANGRVDPTFGEGGAVGTRGDNTVWAGDVALTADGKVLIAGYAIDPESRIDEGMIARLTAAGQPDASFGNSGTGVVTWDFGYGNDRFENLLLQPDGRVVTVGSVWTAEAMVAARWNVDGSIDTSLGGSGFVTHKPAGGYAQTRVGLLQPDGKILMAGSRSGTGITSGPGLVRLNAGSRTPPPLLHPSSDTGPNSADAITADDTPTLQFTGPAGSYFRLTREGVGIGGAYVAGTSLTLGAQLEGTGAFTVAAVDAAGNATGDSLPLRVTVDKTSPAASIAPVSPDPRDNPVSSIAVGFPEPVSGFGLEDLRLTRDGGATNLLTSAQSLTTADGKTFTLSGLTAITGAAGEYVLTLDAAGSGITDVAGNALAAGAVEAWRNDGSGMATMFRAAADAYVRDGTYAPQNFGGLADLVVKRSANLGNTRESYLRFNLSGVGAITAGTLRLFGRSSSSTQAVGVALYAVSNTAWSETGITWNARPTPAATALRGTTVVGTTGTWYEFDVAAYLQQQKAAGATAVAFALKPTAITDAQAWFNSDDNGANRPELLVQHEQTVPQGLVVSAQSVNVPEGGTAAFTVKLASRPAADVTVTVARQSGDADLTGGGTLVFNAANWDVPQIVALAAAPDADTSGGSAVFSVSGAGMEAKFVTAIEVDDDAAVTPVTLRPAADAYVRDGTYAGQNFGTATELVVKRSANPGNTRETYLRFDLAGVSSVGGATLRLFGRSSSSTQNVGVSLYTVSDAAWPETGVTWNTRPAPGASSLQWVAVAGTASKWYEFDVGDYLRQQRAAGVTAVAFVLRATGTTDAQALFDGDETPSTAARPQLVVTPATATLTLRPVADAYARDGQYAATNFGSATQLQVKNAAVGWNRESYLRFDLSQVGTISSAKLRLVGKLDNTTAANVPFQVYASADTTWGAATLTWNNRPAATGPAIANGTVIGTAGTWYELDLTTFLQQQRAVGATAVTLVLRTAATANATILFSSDEVASGRPQLVVN